MADTGGRSAIACMAEKLYTALLPFN